MPSRGVISDLIVQVDSQISKVDEKIIELEGQKGYIDTKIVELLERKDLLSRIATKLEEYTP